jgi:hypothetical protein
MQVSLGYAIGVVQDLGGGNTLGGKFVVSLVGSTSFTYDPNSQNPVPELQVTYQVKGYDDANVLQYSDTATLDVPFTEPSETT